MGPLDDAIAVLEYIKEHYPEVDRMCRFGCMELTFKDGVVYSVGPLPHLVRGKDFHVQNLRMARLDRKPTH